MPLKYTPTGYLEDFAAMLQERGRSIDEFELSDAPANLERPASRHSPLSWQVMVRCRQSGIERTYISGNSVGPGKFLPWVQEAADDLDAGRFDAPSPDFSY